MKQGKKSNVLYMVQLAMMIAIILLMAFTPLGYLRTPILSITFLTVPVAVGAIVLGPVGGLVCGLAFGATSFYTALTAPSEMSAAMIQISIGGTFVTTVVARALDGLLTGLIFQALHKMKKTKKISYFVASLACPILNTVLFMGSLCLFFFSSDYVQGICKSLGLSGKNPFLFVLAIVGVQGVIEAVSCCIIATIISRALYAFVMRNRREEKKAVQA